MAKEENTKNRTSVGKISGIIGIICNCILAGSKIIIGNLAGSMSIAADGLNNLSDAASSIVTLIGFKIAEKPADKEHPYGHARSEYLASLTVAVMIIFIGFELAKSSVDKVLHPSPVEFSEAVLFVLIFSILIKMGMAAYNYIMGKKIKSMTLKAISEDSRNDVIATSAVLIATLVEHGMGYQIDGFMGVVVSLFVLYSGISLARETVSPLLGEGVNAELRGQLTEYIRSCPLVIGCHDLMVHDYGPGQCFASIHVEMDKNVDALVSHEAIDQMERYCLKEFDTHLVIHYDPVAIDDKEAETLKEQVLSCVQKIDSQIDLHDFRVSECDEEKRLAFDLVLPGKLGRQKDQIREKIEVEVNAESENQYIIDVTFDVEER